MSVQVWVLSSLDSTYLISMACCSGEGDQNTNTNTFVVWVVDIFVKMTGLSHTVEIYMKQILGRGLPDFRYLIQQVKQIIYYYRTVKYIQYTLT